MCSATLRERALGRSEGFVNLQVENSSILIKNNICMVHLNQLTIGNDTGISLSSGTESNRPTPNPRYRNLVVRSDYVQYTVDPDNITVKRGYADPVKLESGV